MIARIGSLIIKEFIHLRRDWWLPVFMLFGGALELLLVGYATSRPITNLPMMVYDRDQSAASREFVEALENTTTFTVVGYPDSLDDVELSMDRGDINAAVIIPNGYETELSDPSGTPELMVLLNGAESVAALSARRAVDGLASRINERIALERMGLPADSLQGFAPSIRVWFNEALSEALYTTPAELALMLEFTVLTFAALSFSRERELGTLEQLLVMPFRSIEIIIGKAIPAIIIAFVDFLLMLTMVHFAFGVPVRGSLALLLVIAFAYLFVELGKGLVISVISRTQHQAFLLVMLVGMTDFLFTGYAAPVESMPPTLQLFANLVPAHHWLSIFRSVLLKGVGVEAIWPHVLALVLLGSIILSLSIRYVRRALN